MSPGWMPIELPRKPCYKSRDALDSGLPSQHDLVVGVDYSHYGAGDSYVWRVRRDGRTVTIERSDDGVSFTVVDSRTFGPQIESLVQYFSISFRSHANHDAYADYDYVRLTKSSSSQALRTSTERARPSIR
jgi:hypothetical protein